uniref:Programmed cell death protein 2 n=1 Tax=Rhizophora mucronata TaxID=61149 RepID=A0A2P2KNI3_RHIMU
MERNKTEHLKEKLQRFPTYITETALSRR